MSLAGLAGQLQALRAGLEAERTPGGIAWLWGCEPPLAVPRPAVPRPAVPPPAVPADRPARGAAPAASVPGAATDVVPGPALDGPGWLRQMHDLHAFDLRGGQVPAPGELQARVAALPMDGELPVALACYRLAVPDEGFRSSVAAAAAAGCELPLPLPDPHALLRPRLAVLGAVLMHEQWARARPAARGRVQRFVLDPSWWFASPGVARPARLRIDPGDGRGPRALAYGDVLSCVYPRGGGLRRLQLEFELDGQTVCAAAEFDQIDAPLAIAAPPARILSGGAGATGKAWWFPATQLAPGEPGSAVSRCPEPAPGRARAAASAGEAPAGSSSGDLPRRPGAVLLVEGFPGGYAPGYLHEMFDQHGLLSTLREAGHAVCLVGFDQGTAPLETSAKVVRAAIRAALAAGHEDLVVGAVSMGGLAARYALTAMEAAGEAHGTRVFFTIDTPHRGANTCVAIQWFVQTFAGTFPALAGLRALLDSPANQQFVREWLHAGAVIESPLRLRFNERLQALGGRPRRALCLALASGRGDGVGQAAAAGAEMLSWQGSALLAASLRLRAGEAGRGKVLASGVAWLDTAAAPPPALRDPGGEAWDSVPGGYNAYPLLALGAARASGCGAASAPVPLTCAIPTVSALDIDQPAGQPVPAPASGRSSFDDYIAADDNLGHVQISAPMCRWLLAHIGVPPRPTDR